MSKMKLKTIHLYEQAQKIIMVRNWCDNHFFYVILFCVCVMWISLHIQMPLFLFQSYIHSCPVLCSRVQLFCVLGFRQLLYTLLFLYLITKSYDAFVPLGPSHVSFFMLLVPCFSLDFAPRLFPSIRYMDHLMLSLPEFSPMLWTWTVIFGFTHFSHLWPPSSNCTVIQHVLPYLKYYTLLLYILHNIYQWHISVLALG